MSGDWTFEGVFREEYPSVRRTVALIVGDVEDADEVTQEAFTQLHLKWKRVSGYDRPGAWVRRVAIRLVVRRRNRTNRGRELEVLASGATLDDESIDPDVVRAIRELPPRQRAAIVLRYYADLEIKDVAAALGCADATARVHLHRARETLARRLAVEEEDATDVAR